MKTQINIIRKEVKKKEPVNIVLDHGKDLNWDEKKLEEVILTRENPKKKEPVNITTHSKK